MTAPMQIAMQADARQAVARRAALDMVAQVERQALDIAGVYRNGAGITARFGDFRGFIEQLDHFQVFVDLVEGRLSDLEPEKQAAQAKNLADIRWRMLLLELDSVRLFLRQTADSGRSWPLGSRQFLQRRQQRLAEITRQGETMRQTAPDAALVGELTDRLQAELGHSAALDDFAVETAAPKGFMPAADFGAAAASPPAPRPPASRPAVQKPKPKPVAPIPVPVSLTIRATDGGLIYLDGGASAAVSDACRRAQTSLDDLADRIGTSRGALVLMLSGSDPVTLPVFNHLKAFLRRHDGTAA